MRQREMKEATCSFDAVWYNLGAAWLTDQRASRRYISLQAFRVTTLVRDRRLRIENKLKAKDAAVAAGEPKLTRQDVVESVHERLKYVVDPSWTLSDIRFHCFHRE